MDFKRIAERRYATKKFDGTQLPVRKVNELLEIIRLAPSSFGLQPYTILVIKDMSTKEKLAPASWNQPQITTCSHLLVFCANKNIKKRIDGYESMMRDSGSSEENIKTYIGMMRGFEEGLSSDNKIHWCQKQIYLAVGNALNGAKSLGFDSCPMEGFSPDEYSKILKLDENTVPTVLVTIGNAADEMHPKIRFSKDELFSF